MPTFHVLRPDAWCMICSYLIDYELKVSDRLRGLIEEQSGNFERLVLHETRDFRNVLKIFRNLPGQGIADHYAGLLEEFEELAANEQKVLNYAAAIQSMYHYLKGIYDHLNHCPRHQAQVRDDDRVVLYFPDCSCGEHDYQYPHQ